MLCPGNQADLHKIPDEEWELGDEGRVARLNLSLYGTMDAAKNWSKNYTEVMLSLGFDVGLGFLCNFKRIQQQVSVTVDRDDSTSTGTDAKLKWFEAVLAAAFEIKTKMLGLEKGHLQEVRVLNRMLFWTATGIASPLRLTRATWRSSSEISALRRADPVMAPGAREDVAKASSAVISSSG